MCLAGFTFTFQQNVRVEIATTPRETLLVFMTIAGSPTDVTQKAYKINNYLSFLHETLVGYSRHVVDQQTNLHPNLLRNSSTISTYTVHVYPPTKQANPLDLTHFDTLYFLTFLPK